MFTDTHRTTRNVSDIRVGMIYRQPGRPPYTVTDVMPPDVTGHRLILMVRSSTGARMSVNTRTMLGRFER